MIGFAPAAALQLTGRACCGAGIHCSSSPEPLLIKDIKVQVNKQKPKIECPAQMKHNSDKMTIAPTSCQPCSKPNVACSNSPRTLNYFSFFISTICFLFIKEICCNEPSLFCSMAFTIEFKGKFDRFNSFMVVA